MKTTDFVKNKVKFLIIPAVIILAGIIMYFVNGGFNYDIEFMGGVKMEFAIDDNPDTEELKTYLEKETGISPIVVQKSDTGNYIIKTTASEEKPAEAPVEEAPVAEETAPVAEAPATEETTPVEEAPAAEETPAEEATNEEGSGSPEDVTPVPAEETAPVDETATTDESVTDETATAEAVPVEGEEAIPVDEAPVADNAKKAVNAAKDPNVAKIQAKLAEKYDPENAGKVELISESAASASFGKKVQSKTLLFTLIAILLILAYIAIRFEWRSAIMAVIALVINILVMMAVYAITYTPLNTTFIAAMLTVIGYSINNTIVVFDRIRENMKTLNVKRGITVTAIVNNSIKESMGRTINTTITTLITIVLLYFLGVSAIKEFAFPLIIGVIAGAYTSIFVASTFWANWKEAALEAKKSQKK